MIVKRLGHAFKSQETSLNPSGYAGSWSRKFRQNCCFIFRNVTDPGDFSESINQYKFLVANIRDLTLQEF